MTAVRRDQLQPGENANPLLWFVKVTTTPPTVTVGDEELAPFLPPGNSRCLRSFGHNEDGTHLLITRGGTNLHTDKAYLRYTHQYVLRNDGTRIRGLIDEAQAYWHPPMTPGTLYCLDTHSPHQGLPDPRLGRPRSTSVKVVLAVDRSHPLEPHHALQLLRKLWHVQLADLLSTVGPRPPRWKETW